MRTVWPLIAALVLPTSACVAQTTGVGDNRLTAAEAEQGFTLLFDGKSLDGWTGDPVLWEVKEGMIHGHHDGSLKANSFLANGGPYSDFVLRLSCFVPSGNSGIQYRSSVKENYRVVGYQADIMAGRYWGCLYDEGGTRGILADGWPGKAETVVRGDSWNEYEIIAQGKHLIQRVNGLTCADLDDEALKEGVIALQLHVGPPLDVYFKSVRLKPLQPDDALPPETPTVPAGWTGLFTGKDIDAFQVVGKPEGFQITEGGILRSEGASGAEWMRSKQRYDDFILHVEYNVSPGGNSGVFIRATADGSPWLTGHECQISNEQPPRDELHCTGTLYGTVAADPRPDESPETWHTFEIHCLGPLITVIVDDKRTLNVDASAIDAIKDKPLTGHLGLQDAHTAAGGWIEYRSVWVKELTRSHE